MSTLPSQLLSVVSRIVSSLFLLVSLLYNFLYDFLSGLFGSSSAAARNARNAGYSEQSQSSSLLVPCASSSASVFHDFLSTKTFRLQKGTHIRLGRLIAEGGFSFVYEAADVDDAHKKWACKVMNVQSSDQRKMIDLEISVHEKFGCVSSHLLPLVDYDYVPVPQSSATLCLLVLPLMRNGSLRDQIDERLNNHATIQTPYPQAQLLSFFREICVAVDVLHNQGEVAIAHRDIKPENVLISNSGSPVLMDFGGVATGSVRLKTRQEALRVVDHAAVNSTVSYRAPELFEMGCSHYDR